MKVLLLIDVGSLVKRVVASFSVPDEYEVSNFLLSEMERRTYVIKTTYPVETMNPESDIIRLIGG